MNPADIWSSKICCSSVPEVLCCVHLGRIPGLFTYLQWSAQNIAIRIRDQLLSMWVGFGCSQVSDPDRHPQDVRPTQDLLLTGRITSKSVLATEAGTEGTLLEGVHEGIGRAEEGLEDDPHAADQLGQQQRL